MRALFLCPILWSLACAEEGRKVLLEGDVPQLSPLEGYQRLLRTKRNEQLSATKAVMAIEDIEKRKTMVSALTAAMQKVVTESRTELEAKSGFTPGDDFPDSSTSAGQAVVDALSRVLENAAFFADLALRLPDIAPPLFRKDTQFQNVMRWALVFSNSTGFYDPLTTQLMHLAGMELGMVDKDPDYVNPYRQPRNILVDVEEEKRRKAAEMAKNVSGEMEKKKAEKKAKKRGPRLSGEL